MRTHYRSNSILRASEALPLPSIPLSKSGWLTEIYVIINEDSFKENGNKPQYEEISCPSDRFSTCDGFFFH